MNACETCGAKFYLKKDLNYHVRAIHQKIRPFKCDICKTKFAKKQNLKQHISAVHEKIKAFQCDICQLKFSVKLNLNIHIEAVHENVLRFKCNICDKRYGTVYQLKSHSNSHEKKSHSKSGLAHKFYKSKVKKSLGYDMVDKNDVMPADANDIKNTDILERDTLITVKSEPIECLLVSETENFSTIKSDKQEQFITVKSEDDKFLHEISLTDDGKQITVTNNIIKDEMLS